MTFAIGIHYAAYRRRRDARALVRMSDAIGVTHICPNMSLVPEAEQNTIDYLVDTAMIPGIEVWPIINPDYEGAHICNGAFASLTNPHRVNYDHTDFHEWMLKYLRDLSFANAYGVVFRNATAELTTVLERARTYMPKEFGIGVITKDPAWRQWMDDELIDWLILTAQTPTLPSTLPSTLQLNGAQRIFSYFRGYDPKANEDYPAAALAADFIQASNIFFEDYDDLQLVALERYLNKEVQDDA